MDKLAFCNTVVSTKLDLGQNWSMYKRVFWSPFRDESFKHNEVNARDDSLVEVECNLDVATLPNSYVPHVVKLVWFNLESSYGPTFFCKGIFVGAIILLLTLKDYTY